MPTSPPRLLEGIARAMHHMATRQKVIAQNIANSETPGFKAREVETPDFSSLLSAQEGSPRVARPRITLSGGMAALGARMPAGGGTIRDRDISETKPDGNNVTLEEQLLKMGQVQADFAALTNLYKKQMNLMKTAAGK